MPADVQINNKLVIVGVAVFILALLGAQITYIVPPGHRGVQVTMGKVAPNFKEEGVGFKLPFVSSIRLLNVRQKTVQRETICISENLQEIKMTVSVLYRIPEESVVEIFQQYKGDPFNSLVYPRVDEALKEVTKERTAENTVKERNQVKIASLDIARKKVGELIHIADLVLEDISLSDQLENSIEQKMVQKQNADKAKFEQDKARVAAETAIIQARGEANSIRIRGKALAENPAFIDLQIVDTWDGRTPRVISGGQKGAGLLLPVSKPTPPADSEQKELKDPSAKENQVEEF